MSGLNGRLARLEAASAAAHDPTPCASCRLPHARLPIPLATVEAIVRDSLGPSGGTVPRLCLCPCCGPGRMIALLSHGRPPSEGAA